MNIHSQETLLNEEAALRLAELFTALADPTRVRMIGLLAQTELCVGDLCRQLGMSQPAISHQLHLLRTMQIVAARKEGKYVFYRLDDDHIHSLYQQGLAHVTHK